MYQIGGPGPIGSSRVCAAEPCAGADRPAHDCQRTQNPYLQSRATRGRRGRSLTRWADYVEALVSEALPQSVGPRRAKPPDPRDLVRVEGYSMQSPLLAQPPI